jgi:hypothetical protein
MPNVTFQTIEVVGFTEDVESFIAFTKSREGLTYDFMSNDTKKFAFDARQIARDHDFSDDFRQMFGFLLSGSINGIVKTEDINELSTTDWTVNTVKEGVLQARVILYMGYGRLPHDVLDAMAKKFPKIVISSFWDYEFQSSFGRGIWAEGEQQYADDWDGPLFVSAVAGFDSLQN